MKTAVISTFLVGLASQGMGLFNKFSVHDDPANYGVGVTFSSGRWMLDFAGQLEGKLFGDYHYSLPAFNGILAFFFIAAAACLIIRLLPAEGVPSNKVFDSLDRCLQHELYEAVFLSIIGDLLSDRKNLLRLNSNNTLANLLRMLL